MPEWENPVIRKKYGFHFAMYVHRYVTNNEHISPINWIKFLNGEDNYLRFVI